MRKVIVTLTVADDADALRRYFDDEAFVQRFGLLARPDVVVLDPRTEVVFRHIPEGAPACSHE